MRIVGARSLLPLSLLLSVVACGSHEAEPAHSAVDVESAAPVMETSGPIVSSLIPECVNDEAGDCMPPSHWVDKLCGGVHPEVALHMFRGGSPWKRVYSRARAPAFNGAG